MRTIAMMALILGLAGCPPKNPPAPAATPNAVRPMPDSLPTPQFTVPKAEHRTLANGMKVVVATNNEVPLWDIRLIFRTGGFVDPDDRLGLAGITFEMLTKGSTDFDAEKLAGRLKELASELSASGANDGASISANGITRNLVPTLDLLEQVVKHPTFPQSEWELIQMKKLASLEQTRKNPARLATRLYASLIYGDAYIGRIPLEEDYKAITPADMKAFYSSWIGPQNAILLAGGSVDVDTLMPLLEERFGTWNPKGIQSPTLPTAPAVPTAPKMYVVDSPGAAQSILMPITVLGNRTDPDHYDLKMAIDSLGGSFMARVNMNLREEKGYSYGAYCFMINRYGPSIGACRTGVQTEVTGLAIIELQKELKEAVGTRPFTDKELGTTKDSTINSFPAKYETTASLLAEQMEIWLYNLPADWTEQTLPSIAATTTDGVNEALRTRWSPDRTLWLVVGDKTKIWPDLEKLNFEMIELDPDGRVVGE